jgi:carbon monoxide dehydrogenase subunit G
MEMRDERLVSVRKQDAWDALFDPEVLPQCISSRDSVERISETQFKAAITLAVGPVKALN